MLSSSFFETAHTTTILRRLQDTNETDTSDEGVNDLNNNSLIIRETLRVYGSLYLAALLLCCFLRVRYPRLFNIRSWVPEMKSPIAKREYGIFNWMWKIFGVTDDELLDHCGMDALCFLRALRFGRKLSLVGCFNALWLIPLYATAENSPETDYLEDPLSIMSIANLPSASKRFLGTVVAAYITFGYAMYLIFHEYRWYTYWRHQFLTMRSPRNYAVYVSGIPSQQRSNQALMQYFERCASGSNDVLEAHVMLDTPNLDAKVAKRTAVIRKLEHGAALLAQKRRFSLGRRLETQMQLWNVELQKLNREISLTIGRITNASDPRRSRFRRMQPSRSLSMEPEDHDTVPSSSRFNSEIDQECSRVDHNRDESETSFFREDVECILDTPLEQKPVQAVVDPEPVQGDSAYDGEVPSNSDSNVDHTTADDTVAETKNPDAQATEPNVLVKTVSRRRVTIRDGVNVGAAVVAQSFGAGTKVVTQGTKVVSQGIGSASTMISRGSMAATQTLKQATKDVRVDKVIKNASEHSAKGLKMAHHVGNHLVTSVGTVLPILLNKDEGEAHEGGFVVFNNLYTAQAALQMIHHHRPYVMDVQEAPDPRDIFWRNVGMPARARRTGQLAATSASAVLCFFYTIPITFISSLTEISSLKEAFPKLGEWLEKRPMMEPVLALIAPLLLLIINETFLPVVLKYFAQWEGNVSSAMLEASLFVKLGCFMIIQTFFVSAISGGIMAELSNILRNPSSIIDLLANSLPAQSGYFMQLVLVSTFLIQSMELLRLYPLGVAFLRRFIGPNLTAKERKRPYGPCDILRSLEDPPEFWHAETFAQLILYYMVFFVYSTISPMTSVFLLFCFFLTESGYRYQFVHNYPRAFETGGKLWKEFIHFTLASMIIAQLTLIGLLLLKQSVYAGPALGPLLAVTILFVMFINSKHSHVSDYLPTYRCIEKDEQDLEAGLLGAPFCQGAYLQPSLRHPRLEPDFEQEDVITDNRVEEAPAVIKRSTVAEEMELLDDDCDDMYWKHSEPQVEDANVVSDEESEAAAVIRQNSGSTEFELLDDGTEIL